MLIKCCVLLVGVDRIMYIFRGFCGVHSWQNGTRCRDGGKYCGVIPIQFGWFLRVPSLHVLVFIQKTIQCHAPLRPVWAIVGEGGDLTYRILGVVGDAHNAVNQCCTKLPFFNKCMIDFCTYAYGYRIISALVLAVPAVLALKVFHTPTQICCSKKPGVRFTITILYISQNVLAIDFLHYYTGYHGSAAIRLNP